VSSIAARNDGWEVGETLKRTGLPSRNPSNHRLNERSGLRFLRGGLSSSFCLGLQALQQLGCAQVQRFLFFRSSESTASPSDLEVLVNEIYVTNELIHEPCNGSAIQPRLPAIMVGWTYLLVPSDTPYSAKKACMTCASSPVSVSSVCS
jgi:hypothetical protein